MNYSKQDRRSHELIYNFHFLTGLWQNVNWQMTVCILEALRMIIKKVKGKLSSRNNVYNSSTLMRMILINWSKHHTTFIWSSQKKRKNRSILLKRKHKYSWHHLHFHEFFSLKNITLHCLFQFWKTNENIQNWLKLFQIYWMLHFLSIFYSQPHFLCKKSKKNA